MHGYTASRDAELVTNSGEQSGSPGRVGSLVVVASIAAVLASCIVLTRWAVSDPSRTDGHPYVNLYDPPRDKAEAMIVVGDGQAYAALARDPTLARPGVFEPNVSQVSHRSEAAYRAERPLFGWLGWLASAGQPAAVPIALMALTVLGAAVLAAATGAVARSLGRRADLAFVVVMVPGSLILLAWTGPEAMAAGLGLAGVVVWPRSRPLAVAAFTAAAFGRESLLLFPAAVAVWELRPRNLHRRPATQVATLAVASAVGAGGALAHPVNVATHATMTIEMAVIRNSRMGRSLVSRGTGRACRRVSRHAAYAVPTSSPRSEWASAAVMLTSACRPIRPSVPGKFTTRLLPVLA